MQKVCLSLFIFCCVSVTWAGAPGVNHHGHLIPPPHAAMHTDSHHHEGGGLQAKNIALKTYVGFVEQPTLLVLVSFNDISISSDLEMWRQRIFTDQYSVRQYFLQNSNQQYDMQPAIGDGLVSVSLDMNHPNFGSNYLYSSRLASQILTQLGKQINLHQFDKNQNGILETRELALVFVLAGYEQSFGGDNANTPNIWAHQSNTNIASQTIKADKYVLFGEYHGQKQASIGLICHELGHLLFNLPDLYDRDGSSAGAGHWGVMSFGTWNTSGDQLGDRPANMLAWSRQRVGFTTIKEASNDMLLSLAKPIECQRSE